MGLLKYIHREGLASCKQARPRGVQLEIPTDEPEKMDVGKPSSSKAKEDDVLIVIESSEKSQSPENDDNVAVQAPATRGKRSRKEIVFTESDESSDEVKMDVNKSVPEVVNVWYERNSKKEGRLRDRVSRYREKMSLQQRKIARLSKKARKVNKSSGTVHKGNEAECLQKELEAMQGRHVAESRDMEEKLNRVSGELESERDAWRKERVALEESLARVTSERKWLIEEGFEYVVNRLHSSEEYLKPLGAVQRKLWLSGAHYGVVAGYEGVKECVDVKDNSLYAPKAYEEFLKAVFELEHTRFPYVVALSRCADRTVEELKALEPVGMEQDEVGGGSGSGETNREV